MLTPLVSAAVLKAPKTKLIVYAGGQTLGAASTYMRAINKKPGQIKNIGFDLSPAVLTGFEQGWVQLTSDQLPYLQGYLPILSLCMQKKYGMAPINQDTSSGLVDATNYKPVAPSSRRESGSSHADGGVAGSQRPRLHRTGNGRSPPRVQGHLEVVRQRLRAARGEPACP